MYKAYISTLFLVLLFHHNIGSPQLFGSLWKSVDGVVSGVLNRNSGNSRNSTSENPAKGVSQPEGPASTTPSSKTNDCIKDKKSCIKAYYDEGIVGFFEIEVGPLTKATLVYKRPTNETVFSGLVQDEYALVSSEDIGKLGDIKAVNQTVFCCNDLPDEIRGISRACQFALCG